MSHLEGYSFDYIAEPGAQYHHLPTAAIEVRDGDTVQSQAEGRAGVVSTTIFNLLSRWLHFLGLGQFYEPDLDALLLPSYRVQKRSRFRRETRRCRRTYVTGLLKRLLVASPVMILSLLYVVELGTGCIEQVLTSGKWHIASIAGSHRKIASLLEP